MKCFHKYTDGLCSLCAEEWHRIDGFEDSPKTEYWKERARYWEARVTAPLESEQKLLEATGGTNE